MHDFAACSCAANLGHVVVVGVGHSTPLSQTGSRSTGRVLLHLPRAGHVSRSSMAVVACAHL
eukprot:2011072-Alexandrium_andersonii.AAC.1